MKSFTEKVVLLFLFVFALILFYSYANGEPVNAKNTEAEIWELQITGDTKGKLKMKLRRVETGKDSYSVIGEFSGRTRDYIGGSGRLRCKLEGEIDKNALLADFTGYADMQAARVRVRGTLKGSVSDSRGFGAWNLTHSEGSSAGEWTMKRINPPQ